MYLLNAIVKNCANKFELEHFMKFYLICGKLTKMTSANFALGRRCNKLQFGRRFIGILRQCKTFVTNVLATPGYGWGPPLKLALSVLRNTML